MATKLQQATLNGMPDADDAGAFTQAADLPEPRVPDQQRQPLPAEILGGNLALLVGAIAATLPQELAPQSRYQVAVDLAKTVIAATWARVLAP